MHRAVPLLSCPFAYNRRAAEAVLSLTTLRAMDLPEPFRWEGEHVGGESGRRACRGPGGRQVGTVPRLSSRRGGARGDARVVTEGTIAFLFTFDNGFRLMVRNSGGPITEYERAAMRPWAAVAPDPSPRPILRLPAKSLGL